MKSILALFTAFVLFAITFTLSSCKTCKKETKPVDRTISTSQDPTPNQHPLDPNSPATTTSDDVGTSATGAVTSDTDDKKSDGSDAGGSLATLTLEQQHDLAAVVSDGDGTSIAGTGTSDADDKEISEGDGSGAGDSLVVSTLEQQHDLAAVVKEKERATRVALQTGKFDDAVKLVEETTELVAIANNNGIDVSDATKKYMADMWEGLGRDTQDDAKKVPFHKKAHGLYIEAGANRDAMRAASGVAWALWNLARNTSNKDERVKLYKEIYEWRVIVCNDQKSAASDTASALKELADNTSDKTEQMRLYMEAYDWYITKAMEHDDDCYVREIVWKIAGICMELAEKAGRWEGSWDYVHAAEYYANAAEWYAKVESSSCSEAARGAKLMEDQVRSDETKLALAKEHVERANKAAAITQ
jgi:hypothetical protein